MAKKKLRRRVQTLVKAVSVLLIILFAVILLAYLSNLFLGEGELTEFFQKWTKENRALSYVLYLVIAPLINIIPGISSMFTIALANMLFNYKTPTDMTITFGLCATTVVLTSSLMFLIGRLGGKRIVEWIAGKESTEKFQRYLTLGGKAVIPMMYTLPFFPDDTLCLIAGMTDMSFLYNFVCTLVFRNFGVLFMCVLGTDFFDYSSFSIGTWCLVVVLFLLLLALLSFLSYLYYRHLRYREEGRLFLLVSGLRAKSLWEVRKARKKDLPAIADLYEKGRKSMLEKGNTCQWNDTYPTIKEAKEDYLDGYLYALYKDGVPVACFSLIEDGEPFYEQLKKGAFRGGEDYFTIHRFTSSVPGGGRRCLAAIKKRHHNIRTDTNENNPRMIALLEREGFQKVGLFHIPGCGGDFYAYEYLEDEARDKIPVEKVS